MGDIINVISWWRGFMCCVYLLLGCVACVPSNLSSQHLTLFFSAEVWGGSPFSEAERKETVVRALKSKASEVLLREVGFEESTSIVKRVFAIYEVNARTGLPRIRNGYRVELELPSNPPERITLVNQFTGVRWSIRIDEALGGQ